MPAPPPGRTDSAISGGGGFSVSVTSSTSRAVSAARSSAAAPAFTAKVTASRELAEVEWARGADGKLAAAAGFVADKAKDFSLDDEVKLKPGRQTFHFPHKTADSDSAELPGRSSTSRS